MKTSVVVPDGDLSGRSADYRRGYVRGMMADVVVTAAIMLVMMGTAFIENAHARRAEAELAEMRALVESGGERERYYVDLSNEYARRSSECESLILTHPREGEIRVLVWDGTTWRARGR